jgi:hypothetical protein
VAKQTICRESQSQVGEIEAGNSVERIRAAQRKNKAGDTGSRCGPGKAITYNYKAGVYFKKREGNYSQAVISTTGAASLYPNCWYMVIKSKLFQPSMILPFFIFTHVIPVN